jgi:hypothetical protein
MDGDPKEEPTVDVVDGNHRVRALRLGLPPPLTGINPRDVTTGMVPEELPFLRVRNVLEDRTAFWTGELRAMGAVDDREKKTDAADGEVDEKKVA